MNSNEKPVLLLSVIFFIGAIAIFFYLVLPLYSGKGGFSEKEKGYEAKTAELNNLKNYHASIISAYKELEKNNWEQIKEKIDVNFSSNDPMFLPKMYSFFQDRCIANGMNLGSISGSTSWNIKDNTQSPGGSSERIKKNQFNLSLSGSYASFKILLADLESQALLTNVTELSFSTQASVSSSKNGKVASGSMPFSLTLMVPSY